MPSSSIEGIVASAAGYSLVAGRDGFPIAFSSPWKGHVVLLFALSRLVREEL